METAASQYDSLSHVSDEASWVVKAAAEGRYLRIRDWVSSFLPTFRDLFIYLPAAYLHDASRRFPLLLMHDGQNLFDGTLSYVKDCTWRVGSTADREIAAGRVEPLVIVGVANTGVERLAEYTPTPDTKLGGGKGDLYARMLVEELLPMLRESYRLSPGPEHVGIAGSSLGGLISLAIALRYHDQFGKVGVLSPSIWWDNRTILKDVRSLPETLPLRIWLDMGTAEGTRHVRDAALLAHLLQSKGWTPGDTLLFQQFEGAVHNEGAWAERLPDVLRFLFPALPTGSRCTNSETSP
ncbi:MAG: alpha/beta hydrolase [Janthinobacterium lividum]